MTDDVLLLLAERLADIHGALEAAGFRSCLVDRDWMKAQSTEAEWRDFTLYRRDFAREVLLSNSPSMIERSNPGEYQWASSEIANRISRRFEKFGDAQALFLDSSTRHLMELTLAAQRLSKMLERASPEDQVEYARRLAEFDSRYEQELKATGSKPDEVRLILECARRGGGLIRRLFARSIASRASGELKLSEASLVRLVPPKDGSVKWIEFELEIDPESFSGAFDGALYVTTTCGLSQLESVSPQTRRLDLPRILPGGFREYSRFASELQFVLCYRAWRFVAMYLVRTLQEENWRLAS